MKLPPPPQPAMVMYINGTHQSTRCHNETQLIEYGIKCAEKMKDECTIQVRHWNTAITDRIAADLDELEIET
jgi:hypothetical protein